MRCRPGPTNAAVPLHPGRAGKCTTGVRFLKEPRRGRLYRAGMEQRLSLITLGVADLERARAFY
jgi:hypothetical protein